MQNETPARFRRILIIEEDSDFRGLLAAALVVRGFDIIEASDENSAAKLLDAKPDLVLVSEDSKWRTPAALEPGVQTLKLKKPYTFKVVFDRVVELLGRPPAAPNIPNYD